MTNERFETRPKFQQEGEAAAIRRTAAETLATLVCAGFTVDSAKEYVRTGDVNVLVLHSGKYSVQLFDGTETR